MREPARFKLRGIWRVKCTVCQLWKPISEFHGDRSRTTGTSSRCKACNRRREIRRWAETRRAS